MGKMPCILLSVQQNTATSIALAIPKYGKYKAFGRNGSFSIAPAQKIVPVVAAPELVTK